MSARLKFTKMQGLGNDFVVLDGIRQRVDLDRAQIARARRPPFRRRLRPGAAGREAAARRRRFPLSHIQRRRRRSRAMRQRRALLRPFRPRQGLTTKRTIRVETLGGIIEPRWKPTGRCSVDMGAPRFEPERFLSTATARAVDADRWRSPAVGARSRALSMGNPHAVQVVADVESAPVDHPGPADRAPSAVPAAARTRATCRSSIALTFACACGSAAPARRLPAAPARARPSSPASAAACFDSTVRVRDARRRAHDTLGRAGRRRC